MENKTNLKDFADLADACALDMEQTIERARKSNNDVSYFIGARDAYKHIAGKLRSGGI